MLEDKKKELITEELPEGVTELSMEDLEQVTGGKGPTSVPIVSLFPPSSEELSANKA